MYTIAKETERVRQISIKSLDHHEPEVETSNLSAYAQHVLRLDSLPHEVEDPPRVLIRHDRVEEGPS